MTFLDCETETSKCLTPSYKKRDCETHITAQKTRVDQYTRTESGRLFGKDDLSSGSRVVDFAEVKKQDRKLFSEVSGDFEGDKKC